MLCHVCAKDTKVVYIVEGKHYFCPNCFDKLEKEEQEKNELRQKSVPRFHKEDTPGG